MVTGADRLVSSGAAATRARTAFTVRFHIHPDVRVSRLEGGGILLKLPNGEGWRFRAGGGELSVEESIYLGGEAVRRAEQLVFAGTSRTSPWKSHGCSNRLSRDRPKLTFALAVPHGKSPNQPQGQRLWFS